MASRAKVAQGANEGGEREKLFCVPIATPYACGADELASHRRGEDEAMNHEVRCVPTEAIGRWRARERTGMEWNWEKTND